MKAVVKDHLRRDPPVSGMSIRHHRARRSCAGEIRSPRSFPSLDFFYHMRRKITLPPLDELRRLVHYDPETGVFTHRFTGKGRVAGRAAGNTRADGYLQITVAGVHTYGHRLAWYYVTGVVPELMIDHIDGNPSNNRFCNLRQASTSQNGMNSRMHDRNTSGVKGVTRSKSGGKWQAQIGVGGSYMYLGLFRSIEAAAEAVRVSRVKLHGQFARYV